MTQRPDPLQELPKHLPAQTSPEPATPTFQALPLSPQQLRAAEVAQAQAQLKRELIRVYAQACGACARKD